MEATFVPYSAQTSINKTLSFMQLLVVIDMYVFAIPYIDLHTLQSV